MTDPLPETLDDFDLAPDGTRLDVVGLGNALVDVLSHQDDEFVSSRSMVKGSMRLVEADEATSLYAEMAAGIEASGGSAANTMAGVASFGGRAGFMGRVADDQLGTIFAHDLRANGVIYGGTPAGSPPPTGRCLIVVHPDGERTMSTFLGSSAEFCAEDVDPELVGAARITYLEGYLFDGPATKAAYRRASEVAHAASRQVALTLSDAFCVERNVTDWVALVAEEVDILFANESEILALYGGSLESAMEAARVAVDLACITLGSKGSVILRGNETVEVGVVSTEVVDTTGAGDQYAAGVLYGLSTGRALAECGRLGAAAASSVIAHTGARPRTPLSTLI